MKKIWFVIIALFVMISTTVTAFADTTSTTWQTPTQVVPKGMTTTTLNGGKSSPQGPALTGPTVNVTAGAAGPALKMGSAGIPIGGEACYYGSTKPPNLSLPWFAGSAYGPILHDDPIMKCIGTTGVQATNIHTEHYQNAFLTEHLYGNDSYLFTGPFPPCTSVQVCDSNIRKLGIQNISACVLPPGGIDNGQRFTHWIRQRAFIVWASGEGDLYDSTFSGWSMGCLYVDWHKP